jgi:hypothetical protein
MHMCQGILCSISMSCLQRSNSPKGPSNGQPQPVRRHTNPMRTGASIGLFVGISASPKRLYTLTLPPTLLPPPYQRRGCRQKGADKS